VNNKEYKLSIPVNSSNLEIIRDFVKKIAVKEGFKQEEVDKIVLASDEACANVIEHAYDKKDEKKLDIAIKIDYQKLTVIITDQGKSFDPANIKEPDMKEYLAELRVGGLGIYLMKTLMDEVDYKVDKDRNQVKMVKYIIKDNIPNLLKENQNDTKNE